MIGLESPEAPPRAFTLIGVLFRHRLILLAIPAISIVAGLLGAVVSPPTYESIAYLQVAPAEAEPQSQILALGILDSGNRLVLNSVAEVAESPIVRRTATQTAQIDAARYQTYGVIDEDSNLVWVSVTGPSAVQATEVANATAYATIDQATDLLTGYQILLVQEAAVPESPIRPRAWLWGLAAGTIGLVIALGVVNLRLRSRR